MSKEWFLVLVFLLFLFGIIYKYTNLFRKKDKYMTDKVYPERDNFKGLCLFDIDGTLTDGLDNENVVQECITLDMLWVLALLVKCIILGISNISHGCQEIYIILWKTVILTHLTT